MNRELTFLDVRLCAGFLDEPLRQYRRFRRGDHPANHIAAEDVHDHIQVKVSPLYRAEELADVPGPDLVRGGGQKLRLLIHRVTQLVPALLDLLVVIKEAVHGAYGTMVLTFVQKGGIDLIGRLIHKPVGVENIEHSLPFLGSQGARRASALMRLHRRRISLCLHAIEPGTGNIQRFTGSFDPHFKGKGPCSFHQSVPPSSGVASGIPSIWDTFFWTSIMISACLRRLVIRSFSLRSFSFSATSGSRTHSLRPRFFVGSAANTTRSPCSRHRGLYRPLHWRRP